MLDAQLGVTQLHKLKVHHHLLRYDDKCSDCIQACTVVFVTIAHGSDETMRES